MADGCIRPNPIHHQKSVAVNRAQEAARGLKLVVRELEALHDPLRHRHQMRIESHLRGGSCDTNHGTEITIRLTLMSVCPRLSGRRNEPSGPVVVDVPARAPETISTREPGRTTFSVGALSVTEPKMLNGSGVRLNRLLRHPRWDPQSSAWTRTPPSKTRSRNVSDRPGTVGRLYAPRASLRVKLPAVAPSSMSTRAPSSGVAWPEDDLPNTPETENDFNVTDVVGTTGDTTSLEHAMWRSAASPAIAEAGLAARCLVARIMG